MRPADLSSYPSSGKCRYQRTSNHEVKPLQSPGPSARFPTQCLDNKSNGQRRDTSCTYNSSTRRQYNGQRRDTSCNVPTTLADLQALASTNLLGSQKYQAGATYLSWISPSPLLSTLCTAASCNRPPLRDHRSRIDSNTITTHVCPGTRTQCHRQHAHVLFSG